jgi:hypothetical protein
LAAGIEINYPTREFFLSFCISDNQQFPDRDLGVEKYQSAVGVYDKSLGLFRTGFLAGLMENHNNLDAYIDALTPS